MSSSGLSKLSIASSSLIGVGSRRARMCLSYSLSRTGFCGEGSRLLTGLISVFTVWKCPYIGVGNRPPIADSGVLPHDCSVGRMVKGDALGDNIMESRSKSRGVYLRCGLPMLISMSAGLFFPRLCSSD